MSGKGHRPLSACTWGGWGVWEGRAGGWVGVVHAACVGFMVSFKKLILNIHILFSSEPVKKKQHFRELGVEGRETSQQRPIFTLDPMQAETAL